MTIRKTADGRTISGFKMKLYPGFAEEYEKRHNELWPEMADMLHEYGGHNYSISSTRKPISSSDISSLTTRTLCRVRQDRYLQEWWDFMASVMETNADNSPVSVDLPAHSTSTRKVKHWRFPKNARGPWRFP